MAGARRRFGLPEKPMESFQFLFAALIAEVAKVEVAKIVCR
jgi:hypothetical protein